jgi:hypothetical protein
MLAEEELHSIFSKSRTTQASNNSQLLHSGYGMTQRSATTTQSSFSTINASSSNHQAGFSIFERFEAPMKRPSCNPFSKDEDFLKKLLHSQDQIELHSNKNLQARLVPCDSQVSNKSVLGGFDSISSPTSNHYVNTTAFDFSYAMSPPSNSELTLSY